MDGLSEFLLRVKVLLCTGGWRHELCLPCCFSSFLLSPCPAVLFDSAALGRGSSPSMFGVLFVGRGNPPLIGLQGVVGV